MLSKQVVRRQRLNNALRASVSQHEEALLEGLRKRLGPLVGDDENRVLESFEVVYRFFSELLDARESTMVETHERHSAELRDDEAPRELRDAAAADLYEVLVAIRRAANGHFGSELATRLLDLEGSTSQDPLTLSQQASRAMERLRSAEVELPASQLGQEPDRAGWAAQLEPGLARLKEALELVEAEDRDLALTLAAKNLSLDEHDIDATAVARTVEGFLRLAGRKDLADEVRPGRLRRRARRSTEEEETGLAANAAGGDDTGSESPQSPTPSNAPATGPPESRASAAGSAGDP